jgi:hypothetical protein
VNLQELVEIPKTDCRAHKNQQELHTTRDKKKRDTEQTRKRTEGFERGGLLPDSDGAGERTHQAAFQKLLVWYPKNDSSRDC